MKNLLRHFLVALALAIFLGISNSSLQAQAPHTPTVAEIFALRKLPEPLVPMGAEPSAADNQSLMAALAAFDSRGSADDFSALENFLTANPASPWRLAVETNLGLLYYHAGYFSKCIPAYLDAWNTGKGATERKARALADRAAGEYTKMLSRLGRYPELKDFLKQVQGRQFTGQAAQSVNEGKENLVKMEKRPEISFRCGPMALSRILASQHSSLALSSDIFNSKSTMQGISLADVAALSQKVGLNYQPAKRAPGAPLIIPSVIHWKVGHYAALVKQSGALYLTEDPTFGNETWHTQKAIEEEASGYFLVPSGALPSGWTAVGKEEASQVFGRGDPPKANPGVTANGDTKSPHSTPDDKPNPCPDTSNPSTPPPPVIMPPLLPPPVMAMASYSFHLMLASLCITDTPVSYTPPYGGTVPFVATYCQREANQPSNFNYCNLGAQWNFNWQAYLTDDPTNTAASVTQSAGGGGTYPFTYSASNSGTDTYAPQFDTNKQLSRTNGGSSNVSYTIVNPDGSQEVYGQSDGSTSFPRNVFLTQMIDPQGNATTISYDGQMRITAITDPLGRQMTFTYGNASDPYKITQVTDPFGRSATFTYDASDRLIQIQDMIGIQSKFTYDGSSDFINSLTTPYGTTTFTTVTNGLMNRITATDPAGDTEVAESDGDMIPSVLAGEGTQTTPIPFSDSVAPANFSTAEYYNQYLYYRNTFYWTKKQWKEHPEDHTMAYLYHWLHQPDLVVSRDLESMQPPLESRIWYAYPGQTQFNVEGTQGTVTETGRVVDGGASQIWQGTPNTLGKYTQVIDPLGRQTSATYAANNIDLMSVTQMVNGAAATLQSATYNNQHETLTRTDAAGQTTTYTYNARGQTTSVTDPLGNVTTINYYSADASGHQRNARVNQIIGALPGNTDVWTLDYDAIGRLSSVTGPDGYNLTYTYDNLDRITQMTYPDGTNQQFTYLALDLQTTVDRLGRTSNYTFNSLRQLTNITDPLGRTYQYAWCRCGALSQFVDAMGRATKWTRDVEGRAVSKTFADGTSTSMSYEPLSGRLSTATDEKGQVKTYAYNLDNRLASIGYTNAQVATSNVSYTYDSNFPRLTGMTDGTGATSYSYYPIASGTLGAGRLSGETGPLPDSTITYTYDAAMRFTGWAVNGVGESHILDGIGRTSSATNSLGTFGYTYDGATTRLTAVTDPNGLTCNYDYQPATGDFRLKDITHTFGENTVLQQSYVFDDAWRITNWTQSFPQGNISRSWVCGYDNADQLTSVASQNPSTNTNLATGQYSYTYDPAGNRTSFTLDGNTTTANYNALNQQGTQSSGSTPSLPAQTYQWDAEDRLVAINYTGTNQQTQFQYDGWGRRVRITELQNGSTTSDTRFVWRGQVLAEARDTTGANVQTRYLKQGVQLVTGASPGSYYYLRDHLGSIHALMDTTGAIRAGYDYDPYGINTKLLGDLDTDQRFTGFYHHASSGLALAVYRPYDHNLGRWITRDPAGEAVGTNLYAYVDNTPTNDADPLGLWYETVTVVKTMHGLFMDPCTHELYKKNYEITEQELRWVEPAKKFDSTNMYGLEPEGYNSTEEFMGRMAGLDFYAGFGLDTNYTLTTYGPEGVH